MLVRILLCAIALCLSSRGAAADPTPDNFAKFRGAHPRLFARPVDWETLKTRIARDRHLAAYVAALQREAAKVTEEAPVTYEKTGKRLLSVSRESIRRISLLAFAQRIQPNQALLAQAIREMEALANFPNWNPSHFLDTAEAAAAMAIGYDWLYDQLPISTREKLRRTLVDYALKHATGASAEGMSWYRAEMNWNQVCIGGLTIAALAIAEDEPELARNMVELALRHNPAGLKPYAPDGIYPEGPGYWSYGTSYQVLLIGALESALGSDFGLSASSGFLASASVDALLHGPTGLPYNFSDGGEHTSFEPCLFWFAQKAKNPALLTPNAKFLEAYLKPGSKEAPKDRFSVFAALWWPETLSFPTPALPLRWQGNGKNPVAVFRESWGDPKALYLATKGGSASVNHGHMDVGSFVLEADGVRWARDLGSQDYNSLESKGINLFQNTQDSERWSVYRLNNHSHNTLTINGKLHKFDGRASFTRFSAEGPSPYAVLDLSPAFKDQAAKVMRGFRLLPGRTVLIQDEIAGLQPDDTVRWSMATGAEIELNGSEATLTEDGQTLRARIIAPAGAVFEIAEAKADKANDHDAENPGRRLLRVNTKATASGILGQVIILRPGAAPFDPASLPKPESIIRWQ